MDKITNWSRATGAGQTRSSKYVVVVMVDQEDCPYCRQVEEEFFSAILASGQYQDSVSIGKISIDAGETIIDQDGKEISTREFLAAFETNWTPTVLFLDYQKREIADRLTGLLTPDYYVYYLERSINTAIQNLQTQS
ncbi:MAG: thioredoxin fold domain-containing protein [Gammaproteobacteria bacterium]|nr:thioredoxin fold domain-containing protein [Gammaproteobacteria bacterium]